MANVGFIGLGNMGLPMALNLIKAGHTLCGYDLSAHAQERARAAGIDLARSLSEAVAKAEVVITMLPAGEQVLAAYSGDEGLLRLAKPGTLLIDCSTIAVESAQQAHKLAAAAQMLSVDAPVSGGVGGAVAGTLTFMVGASDDAFAKAEPLLAVMGQKQIHCGGPGAGQAAKICNNMILGASMVAVCEAFNLADSLGLARQALFEVAATSSGRCWSLDTYCPVPGPVPTSPANRDYAPGFAAALMLKDLKLAQAAAQQGGVATPLGAHAAQLYALFVAAGGEGRDFSGIIEFLRTEPPVSEGR